MRGKLNKSTRRINADQMRIIPRRKLRAALQFFDEPFSEGTIYHVAADLANRNPDFYTHLNRRYVDDQSVRA